jgi:hypothetical protein
MPPDRSAHFAELLMSLSLAIRVGQGLPIKTLLRVALVAARLALWASWPGRPQTPSGTIAVANRTFKQHCGNGPLSARSVV